MYVVMLLGGRELPGVVGTGVKQVVWHELLEQDGPHTIAGGIDFDNEGGHWVRVLKDECCGELVLENFESPLSSWSPPEHDRFIPQQGDEWGS